MAHTTLASTDRALEKIGDYVAVQDSPPSQGHVRLLSYWRQSVSFGHVPRARGAPRHGPRARPSELVEDLENDFPRLMEQRRGLIRDDAATRGP